ncbi:MAG: hypothetical protein GKS00_10740 [Alphaproteobacteria bacterium]|nr:hypothetical protein [Alphaproteobacteria bacterium]
MDFDGYLRFVLALVFVLGLIGLIGLLLRRYGASAMGMAPRRKGQGRRLQVVEVAAIDARRRLVLVKRDNREHLILLGASSETLIESSPANSASGNEAEC